MLTRLHPPPDETPKLPTISGLTTSYACVHPPHLLLGLQSLCSCGALKLCLRRRPHPPYPSLHPPNPIRRLPSLHSHSSLLTCL
ncbi:hypothetical protein O181_008980 [Austropuccinia psidii MF-1]|uniref:Uncharacterized protein n=1 Tax=Austropuccinia psidii MF-1 TaxID=1389203 RepID=A0A9Q3BQE8_9BASI|nr:hypothetical protein [Austropuccinia psidii MF-1]